MSQTSTGSNSGPIVACESASGSSGGGQTSHRPSCRAAERNAGDGTCRSQMVLKPNFLRKSKFSPRYSTQRGKIGYSSIFKTERASLTSRGGRSGGPLATAVPESAVRGDKPTGEAAIENPDSTPRTAAFMTDGTWPKTSRSSVHT